MKQNHTTLVDSSNLSPQGHRGTVFLRGRQGQLGLPQNSLCKTDKNGKEKTGVGGGAQGRKWGGFPMCNVASEIAIEDRSEKRFAAVTSFCVIPSEAKRRDEKNDCHPRTD